MIFIYEALHALHEFDQKKTAMGIVCFRFAEIENKYKSPDKITS
jgi:hypothetical protein